MAPRWSLSSARIDTYSGGSPPHLPRRCWCAKVPVRIQGGVYATAACVTVYMGGPRRWCAYVSECVRTCARVYRPRGVPAPQNGRGRRECWRAATRRLRPCGRGLLLPSSMTSRAWEWGSGLPQLSASNRQSRERRRPRCRTGETKRSGAARRGRAVGRRVNLAAPSPYQPVGR